MKAVSIWLLVGLVMIFVQIVIGGVTRLTGSGLSITKWEIVTGTFPPVSETEWQTEYEAYKNTPQYQKINEGMDLQSFKFIYFWEYFHRLWARLMGFVFLIPFAWFVASGKIRGVLLRQSIVLFFLAALVASFGWIMVASGLIDRPWVNTYKLTAHLSLAIVTFLYLAHIYFGQSKLRSMQIGYSSGRMLWICFGILGFQIILGGILSGAKAALAYPSWPDMNGYFIPPVMLDSSSWDLGHFINYDTNDFFPAFIQFAHRMTAYLAAFVLVFFSIKNFSKGDRNWRLGLTVMLIFLCLQIVLGIFTLLGSIGQIPVFLGVAHQGVGILLIGSCFYLVYRVHLAQRFFHENA